LFLYKCKISPLYWGENLSYSDEWCSLCPPFCRKSDRSSYFHVTVIDI
jgi:hypothetical protein